MRKLRRKLSQALAVTLVVSSLNPTGLVASAAVEDKAVERVAGGIQKLEIATGLERDQEEEKTELAEKELDDAKGQDKLAEAAKAATDGGSCGENGSGDVTWTLENRVLTISGNGKMMSDRASGYPWYQDRDNIREVVIEEGVTSIGAGAFDSYPILRTVQIADSVKEIGESAFSSCGKLENLDLGNGVETIGAYAFEDCDYLEEVIIPDSVITLKIGSGGAYFSRTFCGCSNLKVVKLGNGLTSIPSQTFYGCSSLQRIEVPDNVTSIGSEAFGQCTVLREAVIGDRVEEIGENAFWACINLEKVNIPSQVLIIINGTFDGCENLREVTIGAGIEIIEGAFTGCQNLTDVYYEGTWEQWKEIDIEEREGRNKPLMDANLYIQGRLVGLELDQVEVSVDEGEEFQLTVSKFPEELEGDLTKAQWSSSNNTVAIAEGEGETVTVKALSAGTAEITVTLDNRKCVCNVTVTEAEKPPVALESLNLSLAEKTLKEGESFDLTVSKTPENAEADLSKVIWSTSDDKVAVVEGNGATVKVKALSAGTAEITVKLGDKTSTCKVTVTEAEKPPVVVELESLSLDSTEKTLKEGEEFHLTVSKTPENAEADLSKVIWTTSDEKVAMVEGSGATVKVKALSAGTAEITVKLGDKTSTCKVTVTEAEKPPVVIELESLTLDSTEETLKEGEEFDLTANKTPENAAADLSHAVWSSSDEAVATVEGNGAAAKVKAVAEGTAEITVKLEDKTAVCKVTVTKAEEPPVVVGLESIQLSEAEKTATVGEEFDLTANKTPENATADLSHAVWSSSDEAVATVEGNGAAAKVKAVAEGTAEITVKLEDKTAVCKVTVRKAEEPPVVVGLENIQLSETEKAATVGEEFDLTANKTPENATADLSNAVWSSSDEAVATVEGNGAAAKVKAIAEGTAEITVALEDKTAVCKVTVTKAEEPPAVAELESIRLSESARALRVGQTFKLTVTMNPENATNANLADVRWTSSNEAVAAVDQEGNVKGIAAGSATITAALNGKTASCAVTVRRASSGDGSSSSGSSGRSSSSTSGANTWSQDAQGWRYKKGDNTWATNGWQQLSYNGTVEWYYFNDQGYMSTGWITDQGRKYYLNPVSDGTQGKMVTGWQQIEGKWYYFNEVSDGTRGALMTNTQIGEYYVNEEGVWAE